MNKTSKLVIISLFLSLLGCETVKRPEAVGGSKADGIVKFSYNVIPMIEIPRIKWKKLDNKAITRCQLWGYKNAVKFEGEKSRCIERNDDGICIEREVLIKYQCVN